MAGLDTYLSRKEGTQTKKISVFLFLILFFYLTEREREAARAETSRGSGKGKAGFPLGREPNTGLHPWDGSELKVDA